jgi:DNA gyrase subunit A
VEEKIIKTEYSDVMQKSFIDYAMSVIVARALPDVRDGLKPVQRRTIYDMHELVIKHDKNYRKSARIVGDTMGKYHPHGDSSIYDALVVMSQDFKKSMPLIDGHGNFGNIEGDGAAAMRYTEARLEKVTENGLLADLDKDVVDFIPNFDETENEPSVLPAKFPQLLVNGAEGIAVGMATSIPPHNLGEIIDATKAYMKDETITTKEILKIVKGPDFPTGGIVVNKDDLPKIYETGSGKIKVRGKVDIEKGKAGKINVVISEIPYTMVGANIGKFLSDVANLYEKKIATEIVDISNQSSKEGIRIVIELRKGTDAENFVNLLYKKTRLEDTFGVNMLAISNQKPEVMGIKEIIKSNVEFQYEVTKRKYTNLLEKELKKKEVQEGLIRATNVIDLIIEILRGSKDRTMVKKCLMDGTITGIKFKSKESKLMATQLNFTEIQANAILDMRLYKLIGLEIEALMNEHEKTMANIYRYEDILERKDSMIQVLMNELDEMKKQFARKRRTVVENGKEAVYEEKPEEEIELMFLMDRFGYARTIDIATYERNRDAANAENKFLVPTKNTGKICVFTNTGQLHTIKVQTIPFGKFRDKGTPIDNISNYSSNSEEVLAIMDQAALIIGRIVFASSNGFIKVVSGSEFNVSKKQISATKLGDEDKLVSVTQIIEQRNIVLQTSAGYFLRYPLEEIPEKKKNAVGVRAIKLTDKAKLEFVYYTQNAVESTIEYKSKTLELNKIRLGKRDTKGVKVRT